MKFLVILVLIDLGPVLSTSKQPPPNKINSTPSCPCSSQDPSSPPAHQTQQEQPRNPLPPIPVTNPSPEYPNLNPPTLNPATYHQSPDSPNPTPNPPFPYASRPPPCPPFRIPWYRVNEFVAIEATAPHTHRPLPFEFEVMDHLRLYVLSYFFAGGLSYTSSWCQCRPNFTTSIRIQCFLNQLAFSLFLLANTVFPRTHPTLAFMLHRFSVLLMIIAGYLASMPMYPPYIAIIMFVIVVLVYIMNRIIRRG